MDEKSAQECERLRDFLDDARGKLRDRENALSRAREAVRVAQGKIGFAEKTLQRIVDQIASVAQSAAGCALGDKRDCIAVAVGLASEQARQQAKIRDLNDELLDKVIDRDGLQSDVDLDMIDVERILSAMRANGC